MDKQIIIGIHSIYHALINSERKNHELFITAASKSDLIKLGSNVEKMLKNIKINILEAHQIQEVGKQHFKAENYKYSRITSNAFLISEQFNYFGNAWLYNELENKTIKKMIILDQITDTHNAAAIVRSAAFYGVDCVIVSSKGNFGAAPSFTRVASGGIEYVKLISTNSLSKTITKLQNLGVECIGLSENGSIEPIVDKNDKPIALVLGAEDLGISNSVERVLNNIYALKSVGKIKSLNVSVASAVAMEKFFGPN